MITGIRTNADEIRIGDWHPNAGDGARDWLDPFAEPLSLENADFKAHNLRREVGAHELHVKLNQVALDIALPYA